MTPILENIIFRLAQLEAHHILVSAFVETADYCSDFSLGYTNHKSCKILPKFSSTLHFLQESYKFVQESQILQIC